MIKHLQLPCKGPSEVITVYKIRREILQERFLTISRILNKLCSLIAIKRNGLLLFITKVCLKCSVVVENDVVQRDALDHLSRLSFASFSALVPPAFLLILKLSSVGSLSKD